jgi:lysophospholipase L1-like esterase
MRRWLDAPIAALLAAAALLAGAMTSPAAAARDAAATARPLSYLALGDSYTIGEGVEPAQRWPEQLVRALRDDGIAVAPPRIIATTGWTTDELDAAMDAAEPLGDWDFVSVLIGVNNQYRGRDVDEYASQFDALLRRAIRLAGARADRVLVLSIPDWGVTAFGARDARGPARIGAEIDAYNAAARAICERRGVAYVDIAPVSRAQAADAAMLVDDGLHPSAAMYAEWTRLARPTARALLAK